MLLGKCAIEALASALLIDGYRGGRLGDMITMEGKRLGKQSWKGLEDHVTVMNAIPFFCAAML